MDWHIVDKEFISDDIIGSLSLLERVSYSFDVFPWVLGIEAYIESMEKVILFIFLPVNLEFLVLSSVVQDFNWLVKEKLPIFSKSFTCELSGITILINFFLDPSLIAVVIKSSIIKLFELQPCLPSRLCKIDSWIINYLLFYWSRWSILKLAYYFFFRSIATFLGTLPGSGSYGSIT